MPKVQLTSIFHANLISAGVDQVEIKKINVERKRNWPNWEDLDYYFGKDGFYFDPSGSGNTSVRHVHMPPEDPNDWPLTRPPLSQEKFSKIEKELRDWNRQWAFTEKAVDMGVKPKSARYRVSSRVLVYVDGGRHGFLLLHLGFEPDGHDEATANRRLMKYWDTVAKAFIHDGTKII
mgnify:CR=1 FL=1